MRSEIAPSYAADSDGVELLSQGLRAAAAWLERNRERINALNVFPVPDGDTGDNMVLTVRGCLKALDSIKPQRVADVCDAVVEGALQGSRGNSGVILSQMIAGFAAELRNAEEFTPHALAAAFGRAAEQGYKAHSEPVEGTMMTVARDIADAASELANQGLPMPEFLRRVLEAARESVLRTQTLLPRLQQAGVVDAGGEGIAVLLEGVVRFLSGEPLEDMITSTETPDFHSMDLSEEDRFGYCTNFLLRGESLDVDAFREKVLSLGRSALVVGTPSFIKVHVHTEQPGEILNYALARGTLHQIKLDNMDDQYQEILSEQEPTRQAEPVTTALVAVAAGKGLTRVFESDARALVVAGGQSMNPSTGDLIEAIENSPSDDVILLPNNPNVIMSAQKAAEATKKRAVVVPTRSAPVGLVAALAYSPDAALEDNREAMTAAIEGVVSIEITTAVRDAQVDGLKVSKDEYIGLLGDRLVSAATELTAVVVDVLDRAGAGEKELLTLFEGEGARSEHTDAISQAIRARWPDLELDVQYGGQPHYLYVASLE